MQVLKSLRYQNIRIRILLAYKGRELLMKCNLYPLGTLIYNLCSQTGLEKLTYNPQLVQCKHNATQKGEGNFHGFQHMSWLYVLSILILDLETASVISGVRGKNSNSKMYKTFSTNMHHTHILYSNLPSKQKNIHYHAMVKCKNTNITPMMNVIPSDNRISMVFNPNPS